MAKDTLWFKHDYHARNDEKMLEFRSLHGAEGYGVFMMILESLAENGSSGIRSGLLGGLSLGYGVAKDKLQSVLDTCLNLEILFEKEGAYFSSRMLLHTAERDKFREAGKETQRKKKEKQAGL